MLATSGGPGGGRPLAGRGVRRGSALDPPTLFLLAQGDCMLVTSGGQGGGRPLAGRGVSPPTLFLFMVDSRRPVER
jgi:hypothetical protein